MQQLLNSSCSVGRVLELEYVIGKDKNNVGGGGGEGKEVFMNLHWDQVILIRSSENQKIN